MENVIIEIEKKFYEVDYEVKKVDNDLVFYVVVKDEGTFEFKLLNYPTNTTIIDITTEYSTFLNLDIAANVLEDYNFPKT